MIRVLIADDHALMRDGLRQILEQTSGFQVVGEASSGPEAVQVASKVSAQIMLLDLSMPGRNGLEVVRYLKEQHTTVRVIVLTMHAERQYAERAFRNGARGYLTKESASNELVAAIRKVAEGGVYVSSAMAERLACILNGEADSLPHEQLSDREFDVFRRLANGETVSDIARGLSISPKTVSTYKMRIHQKMQVTSDAALVRYALKYSLCNEVDDDA